MTQTLDIAEQTVEQPQHALTYDELSGLNVQTSRAQGRELCWRTLRDDFPGAHQRIPLHDEPLGVLSLRGPLSGRGALVNGELERITLE